jgi:hypothetical protein
MALVSESAVLIGSHAANSRASFPIPRRPPIVQRRPPGRPCSAARCSCTMQAADLSTSRTTPTGSDLARHRLHQSCRPPIFKSSRPRPTGSDLARHVFYTTPGINPSIPKRTATHRLADPPGVCHRACPRQPRQSLRAGVKTRRPAQVSTLPTKIACREPALPMLSGNPVLPGSLAVSRPRTARR